MLRVSMAKDLKRKDVGRQNVSCTFTNAGDWAPCFLANATELCHTILYGNRADIWFIISGHSKVNEAAPGDWGTKLNWLRG